MTSPPPIAGPYRTDLRARSAYAEGAGIYRIVPAAVAMPAGVDDLVALIRWAGGSRSPLVLRGAGSAMGGGNVGDGTIVDLAGLRERPIAIDAARRTARADAAVTLEELNRQARLDCLRLPPDPSSARWATLGGIVSTNAAGARSVRYGSVRRWVQAVELVTADGDRLRLARGRAPDPVPAVERFRRDAEPALRSAADAIRAAFPRTRKNSSGYALDAWLASGDLLDLVIGAEGTLGVVTAVEWRLDRIPAERVALRVALPSMDRFAEAVEVILARRPSALELLDRSFLDLVADRLPADAAGAAAGAEAILLVDLEGDDAAELAAASTALARALAPLAARVDTATSARDAARLWEIRHAASPILAGLPETRRSLQVIEDGCVPVSRVGEYVRFVRRAAAARGLDVVAFGHAGDGHVHVNLLPELARAGWEGEVAALLDDVTGEIVRLGGTPSGEHGDGRLRAPLLERVYGAGIVSLFRRVKDAFDPHGILNPGVIVPDGGASVTRLKTGDGAVPLPPDIAAGLRRIERTGGYATPRLSLAD
jgi:FAD/FMN-containing dehydrogenase